MIIHLFYSLLCMFKQWLFSKRSLPFFEKSLPTMHQFKTIMSWLVDDRTDYYWFCFSFFVIIDLGNSWTPLMNSMHLLIFRICFDEIKMYFVTTKYTWLSNKGHMFCYESEWCSMVKTLSNDHNFDETNVISKMSSIYSILSIVHTKQSLS